jgi:hypothetical protein
MYLYAVAVGVEFLVMVRSCNKRQSRCMTVWGMVVKYGGEGEVGDFLVWKSRSEMFIQYIKNRVVIFYL